MNYTVIGAARSGLAAAELAKSLEHKVFISEMKPRAEVSNALKKINDMGIEAEFGGNSGRCFQDVDSIIVSPGVPPDAPVILRAEKLGLPIISELEFAYQQISNPVIAITGTNGKTTTTALTEYIFKKSGRSAVAAGNIGVPLSAFVRELRRKPETVAVVEVSSFQLERIVSFAPDAAVILNITPDHLGRHGGMDAYIIAKWNITSKQNQNNFLFLNADDKELFAGHSSTKAKTAFFSMSPVDTGVYIDGGVMKIKFPRRHKAEDVMLFDELSLQGVHNAYNSMAAALTARAFDISNEDIRESLSTFSGVEHRLENAGVHYGVLYINDSKATNVDATWYALRSYKKPLIWLAGGRGDSNDYSQLDEAVKKYVKVIIAIGEEKDAIFHHFSSLTRCYKENSLEDAALRAKDAAEFGDIVLFSPACKSFDMFMNYERRGEAFKEIVKNL